jgi:hypothetical protein
VLAETADVAIGLELTDGTTLSGTVTRVGSDWVAVTVEGGSSGTVWIVPWPPWRRWRWERSSFSAVCAALIPAAHSRSACPWASSCAISSAGASR